MTEDQFQAELWQWSWSEIPASRRLIWAIPNGIWAKNRVEANTMKATGVIQGVHDLAALHKGRFYTFELKVGTNTLSDHQEGWKRLVCAQGATVFLISEKHGGRELFRHAVRDIFNNDGGLWLPGEYYTGIPIREEGKINEPGI